MNIQPSNARPTAKRSGLFGTKVAVTYSKPVMGEVTYGAIPKDTRWAVAPPLEEKFVSVSKDQPVFLPGYSNTELSDWRKPQVDEAGKPQMEEVTEEIRVAGPAAQALGNIAGSTAIGLAVAAVPAGFMMAFGILGSVVRTLGLGSGGPSAGAAILGVLGAGAGIGFTAGVVSNAKQFNSTNELQWKEEKITSQTLKGFNQKSKVESDGRVTASFEPVYEEKVVGTWMKPEVVNSKEKG